MTTGWTSNTSKNPANQTVNIFNTYNLLKKFTQINIDIEIKNVKLIRDKNTKNPMGYGFLEFENKDQAKEALEQLNGKPMPKSNKVFKLNWASYNTNKNNVQNPNEYSIYVCELDPSVNEEILCNFFKEKYNSVLSAKIIIDPSTKISKGYGFVKFSDKIESEKALNEMNGKELNGKVMKTGAASYKKNDKKQNVNTNYQNDVNYLHNDPNFLNQQQQYLNQFYLANGYANLNPLYYNNLQQQFSQGQLPMQGQDLNQLLTNLAAIQMMGGNINNFAMANNMNNMGGFNNMDGNK